ALPDGDAGTGTFRVSVVTDYGQSVKEFDANGNAAYANNSASFDLTSTLAPYPDLQVAGLAVSPSSLQSGASVTISWKDANNATGDVRQPFYDLILVQN